MLWQSYALVVNPKSYASQVKSLSGTGLQQSLKASGFPTSGLVGGGLLVLVTFKRIFYDTGAPFRAPKNRRSSPNKE